MANEEEIYRLAAENARIYAEWLKCANEVAAAIPVVKKSMQWDVLCAQAIKVSPSGYNLPNSENLLNQLSIENNYLKTSKPSLPQVTSFMQTGSAVAYSVGTEPCVCGAVSPSRPTGRFLLMSSSRSRFRKIRIKYCAPF
jgi:hypothetical protein